MPKVAPIDVWIRNNKNEFQHRFECKVFSDGHFETTIPDDMVDSFCMAVPEHKVTRPRRQVHSVITTKSRDAAAAACRKFAEWKVETEVTTELRIYYQLHNAAKYCLTSDDNGSVHRNGYEAGENYDWSAAKDAASSSQVRTFSTGLSARVYEFQTHTARDGGQTFQVTAPAENVLGNFGKQLNSWIVAPKTDDGYQGKDPALWVPYTEDRARWFDARIMFLCEQDAAMQRFFDSDVQDRIDVDLTWGPSA